MVFHTLSQVCCRASGHLGTAASDCWRQGTLYPRTARATVRPRVAAAALFAVTLAVGVCAGARPGVAASPRATPRPWVHFTSARNWLNDPNGLIRFDGRYHLFFQYNPFGNRWGHMSWGHATSRDLLRWREWPVAIPEDAREMIFSGSAVYDRDDTSGLAAAGGRGPLVALYTGALRGPNHGQRQDLAFSVDGGRTWKKYPGNPVLDLGSKNFRDPHVFRDRATGRWILAAVLATRHQVAIFDSPDLIHWRHRSDFGPAGAMDGVWECPDLFELPLAGAAGTSLWVLKVDVQNSGPPGGSGAQYFLGHFDGGQFTSIEPADSPPRWVDYGADFYAATSWANLPRGVDRHLWIGWMNNWRYAAATPTSPWRGQMSLPREVELKSIAKRITLVQRPAREVRAARAQHIQVAAWTLDDARRTLALPAGAGALEIDLRLRPLGARRAGIIIGTGTGALTEQTVIGYDAGSRAVFVDRSRSGRLPSAEFAAPASAPLRDVGAVVRLQIFVDRDSIEVFVNGGARVLTEQVFPRKMYDRLQVFAAGGRTAVDSLELWRLRKPAP